MGSLLRTLVLVLLIGVPLQQARAADTPEAFIESFGGKAIALFTEQSASDAVLRERFGDLLDEYFDMPAIGRFLLGRYWRTASDAEQDAYLKLFKESVVYTYSRRFNEYTGQKLVVDSTREDGRFDIVNSRIVDPNSTQEFPLEWRLIKGGDGYRIVDIVIAGVSMSVTQRQEYASVIQSNGGKVSALIDALKRQMDGLRAASDG